MKIEVLTQYGFLHVPTVPTILNESAVSRQATQFLYQPNTLHSTGTGASPRARAACIARPLGFPRAASCSARAAGHGRARGARGERQRRRRRRLLRRLQQAHRVERLRRRWRRCQHGRRRTHAIRDHQPGRSPLPEPRHTRPGSAGSGQRRQRVGGGGTAGTTGCCCCCCRRCGWLNAEATSAPQFRSARAVARRLSTAVQGRAASIGTSAVLLRACCRARRDDVRA